MHRKASTKEMSSSLSPSSLFLSTDSRFVPQQRCYIPTFASYVNNWRFRNSRVLCLSASIVEKNFEFSWLAPDENGNDAYGGWEIVEAPIDTKKQHQKGTSKILLVGIGASLAVLLAAGAQFSLTGKGFRFQVKSPLHTLHRLFEPSGTNSTHKNSTESCVSGGDTTVSEARSEYTSDEISETARPMSAGKLERMIIPIAVDYTQQEALSFLKKLKIVENDVEADELCTRREFARWLVRANFLLERDQKHKIIPSVKHYGSLMAAFDDVNVDDLDFAAIQALAEAGIIFSKLSQNSSDLDSREYVNFFPNRFISRQDLISWKARLEYEFMPGIKEKVSATTAGFMDMKEISSDAPDELFVDMLADEESIIRKVFGQSKRFQPNKPSTKAQAAVALTSGRMRGLIQTELARLEAENLSKQSEMNEIRSELLDRGEIQRFWDEKVNEEKTHYVEAERVFISLLCCLEEEKIVQEKRITENLKEKAAMDCQRQLLLSLKEEVDEMSRRLSSERANYMTERRNLKVMLSDLQSEVEGLLDAKSLLEAEKEASRILRSWVEDEGRKNQARAKVLEEVGRRWKWNGEA